MPTASPTPRTILQVTWGGVIRCGNLTKQNKTGICAWADASTMGVLISPNVPLDDLASLLLELRVRAER
ncbi:hypothetical protein [Actinomadura sp. 6N118]|uniref:hypothetical protein n=1 Tax=Actinomadura sp. 6N118 TaxID=3375151 RepID=UPI00379AA311